MPGIDADDRHTSLCQLSPKPHGCRSESASSRPPAYRLECLTADIRGPGWVGDGIRAIWRFKTIEHGQRIHKYRSSACPRCPIKAQCTTGENRRIARWEHEAVLEAMQARLEKMPDAARIRRQTAEHVFGTLKSWMGATHFLMKPLPNVQTEMSLHVLAYNLKRAMQIFGVVPLMKVIRA